LLPGHDDLGQDVLPLRFLLPYQPIYHSRAPSQSERFLLCQNIARGCTDSLEVEFGIKTDR